MKNKEKGRKKVLWGFIYVGAFIVAFAAIEKMNEYLDRYMGSE